MALVTGTGKIKSWSKISEAWKLIGTVDGTGASQKVLISRSITKHNLNRDDPKSEVGVSVTYSAPEMPDDLWSVATKASKKTAKKKASKKTAKKPSK